MVGNLTAFSMALVIMALVASISVCIFAFELVARLRERAMLAGASADNLSSAFTTRADKDDLMLCLDMKDVR